MRGKISERAKERIADIGLTIDQILFVSAALVAQADDAACAERARIVAILRSKGYAGLADEISAAPSPQAQR